MSIESSGILVLLILLALVHQCLRKVFCIAELCLHCVIECCVCAFFEDSNSLCNINYNTLRHFKTMHNQAWRVCFLLRNIHSFRKRRGTNFRHFLISRVIDSSFASTYFEPLTRSIFLKYLNHLFIVTLSLTRQVHVTYIYTALQTRREM